MAFSDPSCRHTHMKEQLAQYLDRISIPQKDRLSLETDLKGAVTPEQQLNYISMLVKHNNYNNLFEKIIQRSDGRGGRCMEINCLFGTALISLDFDVYLSGARVNQAAQPIAACKGWKGPRHDGWNHMINIVSIGDREYVVDVAFGGTGAPSHPVRLVSNQPSRNIGIQTVRLLRTSIAGNTRKDKELWCYQYRNADDHAWVDAYSFDETEFLPQDYQMMSFYTSNSKTSWSTYPVVRCKLLMEDEELVGEIKLFEKKVRKRFKGKPELLAVLESEEERVAALKKYFGINLTESEILRIHGMPTEIL